jgi:hypothetical protein
VTQQVCFRCGVFLTGESLVLLGTNTFCAECARRPDVDYIEAFRLKHWGKRDGWAWLLGAGGVINAVAALGSLFFAFTEGSTQLREVLASSAVLLVFAAASIAFFFKVRAARWALAALWLAAAGFSLASVGLMAIPGALITALLIVTLLTNWRTRLFFELPVSRGKLEAMWRLYHDNVLARNAATVAFSGLMVPPLAPVGLLMGVVGLRRVDPKAWPPVGRRGYALAGIVLGTLGTLGWGALLASMLLQRGPFGP